MQEIKKEQIFVSDDQINQMIGQIEKENGFKKDQFKEYLKELGIEPNMYVVIDGSGLSRQNRLSPKILVDILRNVKNDLTVYPEFIAALGIMGVDGNVRNRMRTVESSSKARVKTGTLNFVSTLSGFFESKEGELFDF